MQVKAIRQNSIFEVIIVILIILMPLHNMIFDLIIPGNVDNLWRDIFLISGILLLIATHHGKFKVGRYGTIISLIWVMILSYSLISDRLALALNLARTYLLPTLIYFIIINQVFSSKFIVKLENIFIYEAAVLAVWGIFQAFVLGDQFLKNLMYGGGGKLSDSFYINGFFGIQRVTSTLVSPNICGVYFGMAIILIQSKLDESKRNKGLLFIVALGLILTFSRSAIIGTFLVLLIAHRKSVKKYKIKLTYIFSLLVVIVAALVVDNVALGGVVVRMLQRSISTTLNMTDSSALKHWSDLWDPIGIVLKNPLGLGFGYSGPVVLSRYGEANLVESSIYLLTYNFGIIGMIIYIIPFISEILTLFRKPRSELTLSGEICAEVMFTYMLLPNVETYEIIFFVYFFIAIYSTKRNSQSNQYTRIDGA